MRSNRYEMTERKIARFAREGRGKGEGRDYRPWLTVRDFPSAGRVGRPPSVHGRPLQLMSENERLAACVSLYDIQVVDLREQFPLPRESTLAIADQLGLQHPMHPTRRFPIVMTTDLLETRNEGGRRRLKAISVKPKADLDEVKHPRKAARTRAKLQIERRFWEERGIEFTLLFDVVLRTGKTANMDWIMKGLDGGKWADSAEQEAAVLQAVLEAGNETVRHACLAHDGRLRLAPGDSLGLVRRLLARHRLEAPLDRGPINDLPCAALTLRTRGR